MGSQRIKDELETETAEKKKKQKAGKEKRPQRKRKLAEVKTKGAREDIRYIVRIAGKDLNGELPVWRAIQAIKGISHRMARVIAIVFERETGHGFDKPLGLIPEKLDGKLEEMVLNPEKFGVPEWVFNRRKEFESGDNKHLVMADLDFAHRRDLQRLNQIRSYRGLRLSWGLPVRGQRTKSTHRGKGPVVGVMKKEAKQGK